jgi:uncharacterized protein
MWPLWAVGIYIIAVFMGGALVAPWLYWLAQSFSHTAPHLASSPFHRFVNRALLGIALIGLWPLLRILNIKSLRDVGLPGPRGQLRRLGTGLILGFTSLSVVAVAAVGSGARVITEHQNRIPEKLLGAALTGIVVAVLEEILFRGTLFGAFRKSFHWVTALVISSMIYALVHFMEPARQVGPVFWYSGVELLPKMLRGFCNWHALTPGFLTLTCAGALLALGYQRTGNLYFSIGLHGGWIFWLKSYGNFTHDVPGANAWLWGGGKLIDGWMAFVVLGGILATFWIAGKPKMTNDERSAND